MSTRNAPLAEEPVLTTLNADGSRHWLRPRVSGGRFLRYRRIVGWMLIATFTAIPWISVNGRPMMLFDLPARRFTFFGVTFQPTETALLMLLLLTIFIGIFLVTAVFGRLWCGWACPQTVYQELLFRPLGRWIEGGRAAQQKMDRDGIGPRRLLKYGVFLLISATLAHTFLAYFVGVESLFTWMQRSPLEHPTSFALVFFVTAAVFLDFTWFREQTCLVACPYGRFQSALLDRHSLIVAYDEARGESRGTRRQRRQGEEMAFGDCIDCNLCVATCPTGIDIRDGLQMECIHCTQCIDACDAVMAKVDRPPGLIRYASKIEFAREPRRLMRPRVMIYGLLIALLGAGLVSGLVGRQSAEVTLLRAGHEAFNRLADGRVSNHLRVKIANRGRAAASFTISLDHDDLDLIAPLNPVPVDGDEVTSTEVFVIGPAAAFSKGAQVSITVADEGDFSMTRMWPLLGPLLQPSEDQQ